MSRGGLALLLHAHLPFVRDPTDAGPRRDDWFLEALVECYLPLLAGWHRLDEEGIPFRLTFSISPTLLSMMLDPFLRSRSRAHLEALAGLADREVERTGSTGDLETALFYRDRIAWLRSFHDETCRGDLVGVLRRLEAAGRLELITTAATHGFLPGLRSAPSAVGAQLDVALDLFESVFGHRPAGFWLPECGYYPGVEAELGRRGIRWFVVESDALLRGTPRAPLGIHGPIHTAAGVAAFPREPAASRQVWSSWLGYPGDPDYREFYRDIGWHLDLDYLEPWLPPGRARKDTGFKYHRVTGPTEAKAPYVRSWAIEKAARHAQHFLDERRAAIERAAGELPRPPIHLVPFDAELFGHWWFEGPEWLDFLVRKTVFDQRSVELVTPTDHLDRHATHAELELAPSTWGRCGTNEVWVNGANDHVYRHLDRASRRMAELVAGEEHRTGLPGRALRQAGRELLLAQASDWTFQMENPATAAYGRARFEEHMKNFLGLERQVEARRFDEAWLAGLESADNLFPDLDLTRFA